MRRRARLAVLLAVALVAATPAAASAGAGDERPNVLVIMTDDQAADDVRHMPNVRRLLVRQGTTFSNAIASFPLCCPSRATFLTGQFAHNHGVAGNFAPEGYYGLRDRGDTLPVWLRRAGYTTALVGKYLNGYGARDPREVPPGYTDWHGALDLSAYDYFNFTINSNGRLRTWGDREYAAGLLELARVVERQEIQSVADLFAAFGRLFRPGDFGTAKTRDYSNDVTAAITDGVLRRAARAGRPFFAWWSPAAPHREDVNSQRGATWADPRPAPRDVPSMSRWRLPRTPSFDEADVSDKPRLIRALPPLTASARERLELNYQGRIGALQSVDRGVARLVRTLERTGELDDTLIVFTSDNGWLQGQHRILGDKFVPYEESLRVPLVLRGPGVPAGRVVERQVSNADLTATVLDAAGARPARRVLDGLSLLPFARDPGSAPRRALPVEATGPLFAAEGFPMAYDQAYSGVRSERWKYVRWSYGDRELYDLRTDPFELRNLASDPDHAGTVARLEAQRRRLADCRGATCSSER